MPSINRCSPGGYLSCLPHERVGKHAHRRPVQPRIRVGGHGQARTLMPLHSVACRYNLPRDVRPVERGTGKLAGMGCKALSLCQLVWLPCRRQVSTHRWHWVLSMARVRCCFQTCLLSTGQVERKLFNAGCAPWSTPSVEQWWAGSSPPRVHSAWIVRGTKFQNDKRDAYYPSDPNS